MNSTSIDPWFWSSETALWNYGDAISVFLIEELIYDFFPYRGKTHIIGSVLFDGILSNFNESKDGLKQPLYDDRDVKAVFWGCGIRNPGSLSQGNYSSVECLAVRGPVSASDLRLGGTVPQGDPALLLPALYKPRKSPKFVDKSVCVPHYNDNRTDDEILKISGCDLVLRPAVKKDGVSIKAFVDALCSAKFVLAGAMHAAVTAAAYGIPFGFWDSGAIDVPTKWEDIAALLNFPCTHFESLVDAVDFYDREIASVIAIPPLWPLICVAPGFLKAAGVLKILKYELERATGKNHPEIEYFIEEMHFLSAHHDRVALLAKKMSDDFVAQKMASVEDVARSLSALEEKNSEIRAVREELDDILALQDEFKAKIFAIEQENSAQALQLAEKSRLLNDAHQQMEQNAHLVEARQADHDRKGVEEERSRQALQEQIGQLQTEIADLQEQLGQERAQAASDRTAAQIQLEEAAVAMANDAERFFAKASAYDSEIAASKQEMSALSSQIEEQKRQFDRAIQGLAMDHEEQLLAQRDAFNLLEEQLREEMARSDEEASRVKVQFDAVEQSLQRELHRLTNENLAAASRNSALNQQIDALHTRFNESELEAGNFRNQIGQLQAKVQHANAQVDSMREQSQVLVAQHVALRDDFMLAESEEAAKAARADTALSRYWQILGQSGSRSTGASLAIKILKTNRKAKNIKRNAGIISEFLDRFSEAELGFLRADRDKRVIQYLMGVTTEVEDFPIFNRDIYLSLNPDVAEAGVEPFVHFVKNGQWEPRIIHPAMDIGYYISRYPEVDKFKISAIEHYFKYGVGKNYDPSPYFSTGWYFEHYTDVKIAGINPVVHYLRYPGCQPHPDFNSDYYRKHNPDVVRHGVNPLAHYVLSGKKEGRRPAAALAPVVPATFGVPDALPLPVAMARPLLLEPAPTLPKDDIAGPGHGPRSSLAAGDRPIVVMMDAFYPRPDEDSGSLDQVNFIRIFQNLGYDVAYIALLNFGDVPEQGNRIAALGAHCITSSEFASIEEYLFLNQEQIAVMFLSRVHFGGAWIGRARAFCPKARIIFNTVDLHHIREEREAALRGDAEGVVRAQETRRQEYACIATADASIVVSEHERELLAGDLPTARVAVVPLMREIPRNSFPAWRGRQHLAFIGGFQHQPNIDAVNYFLDDIWPIVRARRPDLIFHVIGSHLPDTLRGRTDPNVQWIGHVPEIEPWLDTLRLTVAPLRYGAGAKGKVVSSLLNGVPCVATTVAAEGMGLRIGEDIVACHNPEEFADAIIKVHDDAEMWSRLSTHGFATISRNYSIEYAQKCVENIL